ncbi:hypothetical protein CHS0354_003076 [Potamilus streckersoni]|uniref:Uncharacterized protein n=1 Tax=Potamilus streckersoni TaxID=2493646 RepID=A0AAE0RNW5_9BIVA|nr:hypothetical protein CHS0354_003076 [Potamilus streckersoni]
MFNVLICLFSMGDHYAIWVTASDGHFTITFPQGLYLSYTGSIHFKSKENRICYSATDQVYLNTEAHFCRGYHVLGYMNLLHHSMAYNVPLGKMQKAALCVHMNNNKDHFEEMMSC